jgi:hypothetical protein
MIMIIITTKEGTFTASTNNPEIAEMQLDSLIRNHYTCEDCGEIEECEEECLVDKLNEYPPEFEKDMDEWESEKIERRRDKQREIINNYKKNKNV